MITRDKILWSILLLYLPLSLGASNKPRIEHTEEMYKDLTGDGVEEKLVFSYSGPQLIDLDVSFRIYQIDPETKAEKKIFSHKWNTWRIYTDVHGPDYSIDKVRYYITNFFSRFCFDSSKSKMCQSKCLGSLWCTENEVKLSIARALMGAKEYHQWHESTIKAWRQEDIRKKNEDPNFDDYYWKEFDKRLISSVPVDKEKIEQLFQEMFVDNDITCFGYEPYPEDIQMYLWSPSLGKFLSIGGCH